MMYVLSTHIVDAVPPKIARSATPVPIRKTHR